MYRKKYGLAALLFFTAGVSLLTYGIVTLGLLSKNKIVITTLATTGPDYEVVFGQFKLRSQLPDTSLTFDVSGVMITDNGSTTLGDYLNQHYRAFGDYFVITEKVVGVKQSDNPAFHPLIEILAWQHIDKFLFWLTAFIDLILFVLAGVFYKKCFITKKI